MTLWNLAGANANPGLFVDVRLSTLEELEVAMLPHVERQTARRSSS
jgi:hypothetical protein